MEAYKPFGNIVDADCVIGFSFGTSTDTGSVNERLATQMQALAEGRPMIADRTLVNAMPSGDSRMAHVIEGEVTNAKAQGVGTWGTLVNARDFMEAHGFSKPIIIAQAYHVGRVARQAARLSMSSIIPSGLPADFDKNSAQFWTRSLYFWIPVNALAAPVLKWRGQL